MLRFPINLCVWITAATLQSGCGLFRAGDCDKPQAYQESVSIDPVKVPEGLSKPDSTSTLAIPEKRADSPAYPGDGPCLDAPPKYFRDQEPGEETAGD